MIVSFRDAGTEDVFNGADTRRARKTCPEALWPVARRKLQYVNAASSLSDLKMPPGNRLHPLKHERAGQHAIRINQEYRVCFRWTDRGAEEVEITDYH